jgi:hypothetical protein
VSDLVKFDGKSEARGLVRNIDDLARVSKLLADSGYFTDARDAAQCGVKVLAGLEMGIGAFSSMAGIHVIKGKPSIGAGLMAAAVKRSGKYNYRVTKHTASECVIDFFERGEPCGTSSFNLEDAKAANLLNNDTWKKAPRNMLFARALSNGVRWYCPDVFDTSTYVPEELGADVDEEGNLLRMPADVTVTVQPVAPAKKTAAPVAPVVESAESFEDAEIIEPAAEPITAAQLRDLAKVLKDNHFERPQDARKFFAWLYKRDIKTSRDLTSREGAEILGWTPAEWDERIFGFAAVEESAS